VNGRSVEQIPRLVQALEGGSRRGPELGCADRPRARPPDAGARKSLACPSTFSTPKPVPSGHVAHGRGRSVFRVHARLRARFARTSACEPPLPAPRALPPVPETSPRGVALPSLESLGLTHNPHVLAGGERQARQRLKDLARARREGLRRVAQPHGPLRAPAGSRRI
jgi:hypothetical protein